MGKPWIGNFIGTGCRQEQPLPAIIAFQGIAAIFNEPQGRIEGRAGQAAIGRCLPDFRENIIGAKWRGAGQAHNMLTQNIQATVPVRVTIQRAFRHALNDTAAFQYLKPITRHQQGAAGHIQAMSGTPDALNHARYPFWRPDLNHQIHRRPVDSQIQGRRRDHRAQAAISHRGLYLAPLIPRQGTMMQGNGQGILVGAPQFLKDQFGLRARIDENDRRFSFLNLLINLRDRMQAIMTRPGQPHSGFQQAHIRPLCPHSRHRHDLFRIRIGGDIAAQIVRPGDRCR